MTDFSKQSTITQGVSVIEGALKTLPNAPGVYRMLDSDEQVLYVGKAKSLKKRVANYTQTGRLPYRTLQMVSQTASMLFVTTETEAEALLLEASLIKTLKPRYNILLRDDKSYPYLCIDTTHPFPRIHKFRGIRQKKKRYYGPFANVGAVNSTLNTLQKAFLLRPCTDSYFANRTRPCLQYQIKRCSAPCVGLIDEADYNALLKQAQEFLDGKRAEVQKELSSEMEAASAAMAFERAAELRDRIAALTQVQNLHRQQGTPNMNADVIALHRAAGQCCLQLFLYRNGQHFGNKVMFQRVAEENSDSDVLTQFLMQHYQDSEPPADILLNLMPEEAALLEEALSLQSGHKVQLHSPKRGPKAEMVKHAHTNAREALARKLSETAHIGTLMQGLQRCFGLSNPPERTEVYDNSHVQGTHAIGAMIVATPEGFQKNQYRRFNIKHQASGTNDAAARQNDDYAMMREVMSRRFRNVTPAQKGTPGWPDLLLIDGGQGHLNAVMEQLREMGLADHLNVVGIAKGPDRNAGREWFYQPGQTPYQLKPDDPVLYHLQRLRDEAHRFAIGSHRQKRGKAMTQSALDTIAGVGPKRKKALLHHFGSAKALEDATIDDIKAVDGINDTVAEQIYNHFHSN